MGQVVVLEYLQYCLINDELVVRQLMSSTISYASLSTIHKHTLQNLLHLNIYLRGETNLIQGLDNLLAKRLISLTLTVSPCDGFSAEYFMN